MKSVANQRAASFVQPSNQTLGEYMARWLEGKKEIPLAPKTQYGSIRHSERRA